MAYQNFRLVHTLSGRMPKVFTLGVTASAEWDVGDVLAKGGDGDVDEASASAADVWGVALGGAGNLTTSYADGYELMPYYEATATGKTAPTLPFNEWNVFSCANVATATTGTCTVADVGELTELDLDSGNWGIINGTSGTASTPQFRIIDFNRSSLMYHVIPAPSDKTDVFQWFDAAV